MNKNKKLINAFLVSTMMLSGLALDVSAAEAGTVTRLGGANRVDTSILVSDTAYAEGSKTVVLAGWNGEVDALTGTLLAAAKDAPLLIVEEGNLAKVKAQITELGATEVLLLGGSAAISDAIKDDLTATFTNVRRVSGVGRYETAAEVAKEVNGGKADHVFITSDGLGGALADALTAGPASGMKKMPILITGKDSVHPSTLQAIEDLGATKATIVGGTGVVSAAVRTELEAAGLTVDRKSGKDRFLTATAVAEEYFAGSTSAIVANFGAGEVYADALVGGYFGAKTNAPILLTPAGSLQKDTANYLGGKAMSAYVLGGTAAVSKVAFDAVETIIEENNVVEDLAVESVSAINAKEIEVKFSQAVKEDTVVDSNDKLINVDFKTLEDPAKTITATNADAVLSTDGKTLTITAQTGEIFEGRYQVVIEDVQNTKLEKIEKYDEVINLGKDTTSPTITSVEKVNASTSKVTFSEPMSNLGTIAEVTFSYKLADGIVVPASAVTVTPATDGKSMTVSAAATDYAGKVITATMLGAKDYAGNLINPNPSTFNFQVGEKDGVAPTVTSIKALSPTQIEVNFSEEVQGFNDANKSDFTLTGEASKIATVNANKIEQDKTDKKKYVVTLSASALAAGDVQVADVKIKKDKITDLSGEPMKLDYTTIVTIKKDTVAPKLVSTKVITETEKQFLVMEFDEKLHGTVGTAVAPVAGTAESYKNYVTVSGKDITLGNNVALTADGKGLKAQLSNDTTADNLVKFAEQPLVDGTKYTFDIIAQDPSGNKSKAIEVEFTYSDKADSAKPALVETTPITGVGQDTIVVEFDKELDGPSATNVSNYNISGLTVKKAVLAPVDETTQKVTLTLDKNQQSGNRAITISGVKSKAGVVMDTFNGTVVLKENVKPTVTAAKVTSTSTIELTFSEDVTVTGSVNEFAVFINDVTAGTGTATTAAVSPAANKVVITLDDALTAENLAKTITVKPGTTNTVKDSAGNLLDFTSIVVAK